MPLSATETERRILQLDNDVSIYTMIADVHSTQRRHAHPFNEMGSRLDSLLDRQTDVERRVGGVEGRLDGLAGHLGEVLTLLHERG